MRSETGGHGTIGNESPPYCGDNFCQAVQPQLNEYCAHWRLPADSPVPFARDGQPCYCYCATLPPKTCLENIAEKLPPRPCSPEHCASQQAGVNAHCAQQSLPCNSPVQQKDEQGKCWCCCACATASTVIAVAGGYRLIESVRAGEKVLATGAGMDGWTERRVHETGDLPAGAPRDDFYFVEFRLADGEDRFLLVMGDQLFLTPSVVLKRAAELWPGDGPSDDPYKGHLIDVSGLVVADLAVQTAFYIARNAEPAAGPRDRRGRAPVKRASKAKRPRGRGSRADSKKGE
jgi:hypothetical protein